MLGRMKAAAERRSKQREELRAEILRAARGIVLREGYRALTMRRIAEAIDYSPAAIYQYFENRDAIATALMDQGFEELASAFDRYTGIADPAARLDAVGRAYVAFGLEHPETYRLMFMEDPEITASFLEAQSGAGGPGERAYAALMVPVAELAAAGRLRPGHEPQPVADALWSALHGLVALKLTCPEFPATPTQPLLDTMLRGLFNGFFS
jgi:AcrR family transcriptional regulator